MLKKFLKKILKKVLKSKLILESKILQKLFVKNFILKIHSTEEARKILEKYSPKSKHTCFREKKLKGSELSPKYNLTIIVPAYNVENYVYGCLEAIFNQKTKYTFTVRVINDGSTDNTLNEILKFKKFNNIEVIDQSNRGFSGARNVALEGIDSDYIMFVDSDDKLEQGAIQVLLNYAYETNSDIVEGSFELFDNKGVRKVYKNDLNLNVSSQENLRGYPWGKVFKSEIFLDIQFPEGYWFEDTIFKYIVYPIYNNGTTIPNVVYNYRVNPTGVTQTSIKKVKSIDTYWITEQLLFELEKNGIKKNIVLYFQTLEQIKLNYKRTMFLEDDIKQSIFILSCELLEKYFNGYKAESKELKQLERALQERDYALYSMLCKFS